jgi:N-acetylglucosaminyldiphosphoundecaprenol N-acetyl-beta-D-mannosaminyltransferase
MRLPRKRTIAGVGVSLTDYQEVLDAIDAALAERTQIAICCCPASSLMFARDDPEAARALAGAEIVTPDGMGVVYASRLLGEALPDRVYGPDLMELQLARAAAAGTPTFLYGGFDEQALEQLRRRLVEAHHGLRIVGGISPPHRPPSAAELAADVAEINASGAQIVWVGLGSPKQEIWIDRQRAALDATVLCGVGAAFDFAIDRVAQAPRWMQDHGLEWLFRLAREPRRLGRRYAVTLPRFALAVIGQRLRGE